MSLAAGRLASIALGLVEMEGVEELEEDDDVVVDEDEEEQVLLSESESLEFVLCPGMFPLVVSVSMCGLSVVWLVECVVFVCVSVCLWISSLFMPASLAARGQVAGFDRWRCDSIEIAAALLLLLSVGSSKRSL